MITGRAGLPSHFDSKRSEKLLADTGQEIITVIAVFTVFSVALLGAAWYASALAPRLMERNYSTVKYAAQMQSALTNIYLSAANGREPAAEEISKFDSNLGEEKRNITEIGESEAVASIQDQWAAFRQNSRTPTPEAFLKLSATLEALSAINEKAMYEYERQARTISRGILVSGVLGLALVLVYAIQAYLQSSVE